MSNNTAKNNNENHTKNRNKKKKDNSTNNNGGENENKTNDNLYNSLMSCKDNIGNAVCRIENALWLIKDLGIGQHQYSDPDAWIIDCARKVTTEEQLRLSIFIASLGHECGSINFRHMDGSKLNLVLEPIDRVFK